MFRYKKGIAAALRFLYKKSVTSKGQAACC